MTEQGSPRTVIVTFLFTDIEGSSRLEQQVGTAAYADLLARHRSILRTAFRVHGGLEQGTEGDSFFVVFPSASGAIQAAVDGQSGLSLASWPDGVELRVRMGIHTGEAATNQDGGYIGIDINRAARMSAAAHGGQIVASEATRALAAAALPAGIGFRDLGQQRLKDFEPIRLYQIEAPDLLEGFPPLRSAGSVFGGLPSQPSSFVGRTRAISEIRDLLERTRLVTLTGPGGTGKTRLALATADDVADRFPDGAGWVGLASITDPSLVPAAIAASLGVVDTGTRDLGETIAERIGPSQALLVLDNFEHLLAASPLVGQLVTRTSALRILVTSQAVLRIAGEQEYPVPPLEVPNRADATDLATVAGYEAVDLFVQRARAARPDFALTAEIAPTIAAICARLDGLPLAIELAAARIRILTPPALLSRLDSALGLLSGGARDVPERQQTLRAAIGWSYELLDPEAQGFFAQLAVFAGSWSLEATVAVCDPDGSRGPDVIIEALFSLVEKSLIRSVDEDTEEPRFRMLQVIRDFGLEKLGKRNELDEMRKRHLDFYAGLANRAEPELLGGKSKAWLDRLELDHDNIRVALRWAIKSGRLETGLVMAGQLWRFWHRRGHIGEGQAITEEVLADPRARAPTTARAIALNGAGGLAYWRFDFATARGYYEEHLDTVRNLGDRRGTSEALLNLGFVSAISGDFDAAIRYFTESQAIADETGDELQRVQTLNGLAVVYLIRGTPGPDDIELALAVAREGIEIARRHGSTYWLATMLGVDARANRLGGNIAEARRAATGAIELFGREADPSGVAMMLDDLGSLAMMAEETARAVRLAGAAEGLRAQIAGGAPPALAANREYVEPARQALDPEASAREWRAGQTMSLEQAVAYAVETEDPATSAVEMERADATSAAGSPR